MVLRFGEGGLQVAAVPLEAPVTQSVRPRHERLTPATRAHLVARIAVEHGPTADRVGPKTAAHLDHDGLLVPVGKADLSS